MSLQPPAPLTVGYLLVGPPEHGICRYGRLLAAEGRRRADVNVLEHHVILTGNSFHDWRLLRGAARKLAQSSLVHLQVSVWGEGTWGGKWHAVLNLYTFRRHCRVPVIVTLHDLNTLQFFRCVSLSRWLLGAGSEGVRAALRPGVRLARQLSRGRLRPRSLFRALWTFTLDGPCLIAFTTARVTRLILVLTKPEQAHLQGLNITKPAVLIPHFVEDIRVSPSAHEPSSTKILVVAGFIFKGKGHEIILNTLPLLPDVKLIFLGGPGFDSAASEYYSHLRALAHRNGIQDRVEMTGYLPDEEYYRRLAAADLAICPFSEDKSASGSLSSLIAVECPILASAIPLVADYNEMVPGAIPTFSPYTPAALAAAVRILLQTPRATLTRPLRVLRQHLSIGTLYEQHLAAYRRVIGNPSC
jgi:glycosyltransferase involved in cell wall biosynthesis